MDTTDVKRNEANMPATEETRDESKTYTDAAHRCALIWFAISCPDVFEAVTTGNPERLRDLQERIDLEAFKHIATLVEKAGFTTALATVHSLWQIQCSPPPCSFSTEGYETVVRLVQEGLGPAPISK